MAATLKKELLAPAGDPQAGYAALYYGADAVYLGLKQFSARATAGNFSAQELNEFTGYAHFLGRKVFVAINTVLQERELPDLMQNLAVCAAANVDALIVQDLGVARVVKTHYPQLALHASTQMAVHNLQGALALQNLGFERVVLARELTAAEISAIAKAVDIELECFIHGALCYSYSGVCQFSSMESSRSANRGKCLYPCRDEFVKDGKKGHWFSMKDMALQGDIAKLPVYSLKIEGRKKNALYVAAVVDYYRRILDGHGADAQRAANIKQIFSRPWCKFHFMGRNKAVTDSEYVGHRGLEIGEIESVQGRKIVFTPRCAIARHDGIQIDIAGEEKPYGFSLMQFHTSSKSSWEVKAGEKVEVWLPQTKDKLQKGMKVYLASSSRVKGAYDYSRPKAKEFWQKPALEVEVIISQKQLTARANRQEYALQGEFAPALSVDKMTAVIEKVFAKTGDEKFSLHQVKISNPQRLFVPVSLLNELRRGLYAKIEITDEPKTLVSPAPRQVSRSPRWIIKVDNCEYLRELDLNQIDEIMYLLSENTHSQDLASLPQSKLRFALPVICRDMPKMQSLINELISAGYRKWEISNYWGLGALSSAEVDLSFDHMLYTFNTQAAAFAMEIGAKRITLPVEDTLANLQTVAKKSPLDVAMVVYQDAVLFNSAVCVRENSCTECNRHLLWSDLTRNGKSYRLRSENCQTWVFAKQAFSAADIAPDVAADWLRADFCYVEYTPSKVQEIWQQIRGGKNPPHTRKANLIKESGVF
ncbi:MAG: U32 family peptidase [Alphaproteobacteria bacterium]|nr:U32 family peptidase [Alphaproteobacteria bacterium]